MNADAYAAAGVDIEAAARAVQSYRRLQGARADSRVLSGIGGFAGCFALGSYRDPVLVASTDGVGTKVQIAAALERYDGIGEDLVNHCIDDILCENAQPLFFLDYLGMHRLRPVVAEALVGAIARACGEYQIALLGGETAEMPDVYAAERFEVAGTIVGVVERDQMLDRQTIAAGDVIIGLAANGFHTNGYSLVRKLVPAERFSDALTGSEGSLGDALLAAHPCYLRYVRAVQTAATIKAMAHITGGGLPDNVARILPDGLTARFTAARWPVPVLMDQVVTQGRLTPAEAYGTFNMGVGFCIAVGAAEAEPALTAARSALAQTPIPGAAWGAAVVGEIEPAHPCGPQVIIG
ncbi:MAG: phosphoribosylformylglycinamidine cyclo-ligase [Candidatus Eremiobacteraeota bacterium]|nr:phosphoribosylformylglycinamidine cyclo-ligase [Candidatus Eremiobacteraeota bacterium]